MPRVVIVGAGVSGLACGFRLAKLARETGLGLDVDILEGSHRAGGLIRTERADGFVIDRGPESILTDKPAGMRLIEALGLAPRLVRTREEHRGAYVVAHGRLERIPQGFSLLAPGDLGAWLRTPYISVFGRLRALLDLALPSAARDDETLGTFVRRRFGQEVLDRLAQPLVGGIYGAHPDVLGLAATLPRFLEMERRHGSVIRGVRARAKDAPAQGARYGLFVNFDGGMQVLTDAMGAAVADTLRFGTKLASVARAARGFELTLANGTAERADALVLAVGGRETARLAAGLDASLGERIGSIRHGSGAIVTLAFPTEAIGRELDAYGYVTPNIEGRRITASTWLSRKWPGRAPDGVELMRFFFGRDGDDQVVDLADDELVRLARFDAAALMMVRGEPLFVRVDRWREAMPRFGLMHLREIDRIDDRVAAIPGLALAGNAYRGVGIPDSIASGEAAAQRTFHALFG
jgi:oxygen-dependent protoporphyrinogen oxidase